jgi:hypothetical protein
VPQGFLGRDAKLRLDQVDTHHLLSNCVLDLNPRIAFDKEMFAGFRNDEELDRSCVYIVSCARKADGAVEEPLPQRGIECGAGAILITFWLRSCTEQSRSYRWMTLP